jgi:hypothetical protein
VIITLLLVAINDVPPEIRIIITAENFDPILLVDRLPLQRTEKLQQLLTARQDRIAIYANQFNAPIV